MRPRRRTWWIAVVLALAAGWGGVVWTHMATCESANLAGIEAPLVFRAAHPRTLVARARNAVEFDFEGELPGGQPCELVVDWSVLGESGTVLAHETRRAPLAHHRSAWFGTAEIDLAAHDGATRVLATPVAYVKESATPRRVSEPVEVAFPVVRAPTEDAAR